MTGILAIGRMAAGNGRLRAMAQVVVLRSLALTVSIGTGLLTASMLGATGRGEQAVLMIPPLFLTSVSTLGLHASLIYNMKADPGNDGAYFGASMVLAFCAGIVAVGIGWVVAPLWLHQYDHHVVATARLLLLFTPLMVVTPLLTGVLESRGQFGAANGTLYLQGIGTLLALGTLWDLGLLTPVSAAISYLAPGIPAMLYFGLRLRPHVRPSLRQFGAFARPLLHYGLRFYGVDVLGAVSTYLDQLMIATLLAPGLVGNYVVALSLSRVLTVLQGAVTSVLFPSVAGRPKAGVVETVGMAVRMCMPVGIVAGIALAIVAPPLVHYAYGKSFDQTIAPFYILLAETVVSNSARILYQAYSGTGRPGVVTSFEAIGVSISLTSMLLIVPHHGVIGAACCVLLASSVRLACAIAGLPLILHVRVPRLVIAPADLQAIRR